MCVRVWAHTMHIAAIIGAATAPHIFLELHFLLELFHLKRQLFKSFLCCCTCLELELGPTPMRIGMSGLAVGLFIPPSQETFTPPRLST